MLEKVRYVDPERGVSVAAFTDGYAYDGYSRLYLLSAAGRDSSVKAVTAALINGRELEIVSDDVIAVQKAWGEQYRIMGSKLPSGLVHQLVAADGFFAQNGHPARLVYGGDGEGAAATVYEAVRRSYPVPLIPEWSEWLYGKLLKTEGLRELAGNRMVLELDVSEEMLDGLVCEGVKRREITF